MSPDTPVAGAAECGDSVKDAAWKQLTRPAEDTFRKADAILFLTETISRTSDKATFGPPPRR